MDLRSLSRERPIVLAVLAIILSSILTELPLKTLLMPFLGLAYGEYTAGILEQGLTTLLLVLLMANMGLRNPLGLPEGRTGRLGFSLPSPRSAWWLGWPLVLFALLNASDAFGGSMGLVFLQPMTLVLLLLYVSTGFLEEVLFRGLVLGLLLGRTDQDRKARLGAVLLMSAFFALAHIANLVTGRYTLLAALTQVCFAFFFGVFFGAIALRSGSLVPGIILHTIVDFAGNLRALVPGALPHHELVQTRTLASAAISVAITLPLLLYGLFLLRARKGQGRAAQA